MKESSFSEMEEGASRTAHLIAGFIRNTLTEPERDELDDWVNADDHNMQLFEELTDENNLAVNLEWMDKLNAARSYEAMQERGAFDSGRTKLLFHPLLIAAASVIILFGIFFIYRTTTKTPEAYMAADRSDTAVLQPGGNRASLVLADGRIIDLTKVTTGEFEGNAAAHVAKIADGALEYETLSGIAGNEGFHTLSTPVGGQYQVQLPDGSKVWLNASSSIRYSPVFTGAERKVQLTGEAYFEVAKDANRPFKVLLEDNTAVVVTGTHFNVSAYANDPQKQVSLLEGAVTVQKAGSFTKLEPGTQALIQNNRVQKVKFDDSDEVTGWKDGLFVFTDAPMEVILKQIGRWYDAEIIYKASTPELFNARISRKEPLARVLKLLELNGYVHFKTEKNKIYVLP